MTGSISKARWQVSGADDLIHLMIEDDDGPLVTVALSNEQATQMAEHLFRLTVGFDSDSVEQ